MRTAGALNSAAILSEFALGQEGLSKEKKARVQKLNMEQAKSFTEFPHPAAASTCYCILQLPLPAIVANPTCVIAQLRGRVPQAGGRNRKTDKPAPLATVTKPSKDSQVLAVAVAQDSSKCNVEKSSDSPDPKLW